jgi:hypothetical protein
MNSREFSKCALEMVREGFPQLYATRIHGRRSAFIAENAPNMAPVDSQWQNIGHVPQHMQLVWALAQVMHSDAPRNSHDLCKDWQMYNMLSGSAALSAAFRDYILNRCSRRKGWLIVICSDWSIRELPKKQLPAGEQLANSFLNFGVVLEGVAALNLDLQSCCRPADHWDKLAARMRSLASDLDDERLAMLYRKLRKAGWSEPEPMPLSTRHAAHHVRNVVMQAVAHEQLQRQ